MIFYFETAKNIETRANLGKGRGPVYRATWYTEARYRKVLLYIYCLVLNNLQRSCIWLLDNQLQNNVEQAT